MLGCLLAGFCCASAQAQPPVRSVSGQFSARLIQRARSLPSLAAPSRGRVAGAWTYLLASSATGELGNNDEVTLQPSMLVVSCEQIKKLMLNRLGLADQWHGRIDLVINPALSESAGPQLSAISNPRGWNYQLQLPQSVREEILMRWVIDAMLLEIANRQSGVQSAEIPLWLVEGMSADLEANNLPTFMHESGQNVTMELRWNKRAQMLPMELRRHAPLSFQQLSWPQESDLTEQGLPLYRGCSQFFLEELLRLDDGQSCLRSMITQLSEHWNWQTAFLRAFHSHFAQLLDVEKWWSVGYVDFIRGYKTAAWSDADCRKTLQNNLDVRVAVHFGSNQLPVDARLTLQEVIKQWPARDARGAVERAVSGLKFLEPRATPAWRPLVSGYIKALLVYLDGSREAAVAPELGKHSPALQPMIQADAIKQLDALDRRRESIWNSANSAAPMRLTEAQRRRAN
ncbi:MAG TPA: hypothetical protein VGO59_09840 [Verrucomicrobiae bacterium]